MGIVGVWRGEGQIVGVWGLGSAVVAWACGAVGRGGSS